MPQDLSRDDLPRPPEETLEATEHPDSPTHDPELETWPPGSTILEEYRVERLLGRGGMGAVHLVRSETTGELFAVKRVLPWLVRRRENLRSFLLELLAWSQLPEHPHLTAFRFFRALEEEILIFAEYVDGGSLREWLQTEGAADPATILDIAIQTAWGLREAHRLGLVHQDVKPGNVLLTAQGVAKVTDFGLAHARRTVEGEPSEPAPGIGEDSGDSHLVSCRGRTPAFCSPEQALGMPLTQGTDIWSWGLTVLTLYAGDVSWFAGEVAPELLAHLTSPEGREECRVAIPAPVAAVLERCFRLDPAERWPSLEEALRTYREAEQVLEEETAATDRPRLRQELEKARAALAEFAG